MAADIVLPKNVKIGMPGDNLTIKVRLSVPIALSPGLRFAFRESGKTVGHGIITTILPKDEIPVNIGRITKQEMAEKEAAEGEQQPAPVETPKKKAKSKKKKTNKDKELQTTNKEESKDPNSEEKIDTNLEITNLEVGLVKNSDSSKKEKVNNNYCFLLPPSSLVSPFFQKYY